MRRKNKNKKIQSKKNNFDQRTSRLITVVLGFSFLVYLLKEFYSILVEKADTLIINKGIPFAEEYIFVQILFTAILIVIGYLIKYCYNEYFNLCHFKSVRAQKNNQEKADLSYKKLLATTKVMLVLITVFLLLTNFYFSAIKNAIKGIVSIIICLIFIISFIYYKPFKNMIRKNHFEEFNLDNKFLFENLGFFFIGFIFVCLIGIVIPLNSLNEHYILNFKEYPKPSIKIECFNNLPEDIKLFIENNDSNLNKFSIKRKDFKRFEIMITQKDINPDDNLLLENKEQRANELDYAGSTSYYKVTKEIPFLKQGKNIIVIQFYNENILKRRKITILNEIYLDNNEVTFTKNKIKINN